MKTRLFWQLFTEILIDTNYEDSSGIYLGKVVSHLHNL